MTDNFRTKNREDALNHWPPDLTPDYRLKDRTNIRYNYCVAQWYTKRINKITYWVFLCDCGNYFEANAGHVNKGNIKSCGCLRKKIASLNGKNAGRINGAKNGKVCIKDHTGEKYGNLTFIEPTEERHSGNIVWKVQHDDERIFKATYYDITHGIITGNHNYLSFGEQKTKESLIALNINFIQEYKFSDCKNKKPLPFDFYLPDYNICIECDGIQHFKPIKYYGGEEKFIQRQQNDKIKTQYCKNNNIKLIRIPYQDYSLISSHYLKERLSNG